MSDKYEIHGDEVIRTIVRKGGIITGLSRLIGRQVKIVVLSEE